MAAKIDPRMDTKWIPKWLKMVTRWHAKYDAEKVSEIKIWDQKVCRKSISKSDARYEGEEMKSRCMRNQKKRTKQACKIRCRKSNEHLSQRDPRMDKKIETKIKEKSIRKR